MNNPTVNGRTFTSKEAVLEACMAGSLSQADALKALESMTPVAKQQGLSLKTSRKGAISVYGMGRFPVTLYLSQWERVFTELPALVKAHAEADKPQDHAATATEPAVSGVKLKRGKV